MAKGGTFEREMCVKLSLWWSGGKDDAIFWRSANSGGRATVRRQKGKDTFGNYGDIRADDPDGQHLLRFATLEFKRGYSRCTLSDLVDRHDYEKCKGLEAFLVQAMEAAESARSFSWMLIHRRDKKQAVVYFPSKVFLALREADVPIAAAVQARLCVSVQERETVFYAALLDRFLAHVKRHDVLNVLDQQGVPLV